MQSYRCQSFCSYQVGWTGSFWKTLKKSAVSEKPAPGAAAAHMLGIMDGELPAGGASHREAPHHQPVLVDRVVSLDVVERLEQVDLAGELVGVAVAAVGMQDERVRRRELAAATSAGR